MNKELIYDKKISPLMSRIIEICQENGIAMLASFALPTGSEPRLLCNTILADGEGKNANGHREALRIIEGIERQAVMIATEKHDGTKEITAFLG